MTNVDRPPSSGQHDFAAWVSPHLVAMAGLAARLTSAADRDDVVQDALTAAWRKFASYDPQRGQPRTWLLAITADQARKTRRRHHRLDLTLGSDHDHHVDRPIDVDLERAVVALPHRQRLAVALYYFLDLPVAEVAAVMGCSPGTVKSTLSHARASLKHSLGEDTV